MPEPMPEPTMDDVLAGLRSGTPNQGLRQRQTYSLARDGTSKNQGTHALESDLNPGSGSDGGYDSSASHGRGTPILQRRRKLEESLVENAHAGARAGVGASPDTGAEAGIPRGRGRAASLTHDHNATGASSPSPTPDPPHRVGAENAPIGTLPIFVRPRALSAGSSATFSVAASSIVGPLDVHDLDAMRSSSRYQGQGTRETGLTGRQAVRPFAAMRRMPKGVLRRLRTQSRLILAVGPDAEGGTATGSGR